jgi:hypothetical protein
VTTERQVLVVLLDHPRRHLLRVVLARESDAGVVRLDSTHDVELLALHAHGGHLLLKKDDPLIRRYARLRG